METNEPLSVLIVDDDAENREQLSLLIEAFGFRCVTVASGAAALERLSHPDRPDVVILDVLMPDLDGVETLRRYRAGGGLAPVVMCSALDEADTVVRAMRAGANDYITKPYGPEELREIIGRACNRPGRAIQKQSSRADRCELGASPSMRSVDELVDRIADVDVPILITGESGVGKDVVAREIHARSSRANQVFIKINCAALASELLETELFGHERGSFTGADRAKSGQFELAHGGTLFLDEIGEMPVGLQAKLLQVLQDGEFYRVGGQKKIKVDARIIVATNVNLARAIAGGRFREDLYYRLNVVEVAIPPLRERREDIAPLTALFVEKYGKRYGRDISEVPSEILDRFRSYNFPGNVRELENLVRRLIVLRDSQFILNELRPAAPTPVPPATPPPTAATPARPSAALFSAFNSPSPLPPALIPPPPLEQIAAQAGGAAALALVSDDYRIDLKELGRRAAQVAEREAIIIMLGYVQGHRREAAERLGISYKAILYKIRDYGIARPRRRNTATPTTEEAAVPTDAPSE
jgi:two-component system response regulator AtoC